MTVSTTKASPQVFVLLAARNGETHLPIQLNSIAEQSNVHLRLAISVDASTDNSLDCALNWAKTCSPPALVLSGQRFGSAAANFFELLTQFNRLAGEDDYLALCDQDDLWHPHKLADAVKAIASGRCEAVSTSVMAFWPDGRRKLLAKGQALRAADHWFESAGPGCTYVLRADVARELSGWVATHREVLRGVDFHDWLIYAWVRSRGYRWWIDPQPSMDYRQHAHNVLGAHAGLAGVRRRLGMLLGGWYLQQVLRIAEVCGASNHPFIFRLRRDRWTDRLALALQVGQMRRKPLDRLALALALLFGRRTPR